MRNREVKKFFSFVMVFAMMFTMMMPITAIAAPVSVMGITVTGASTVNKGSTIAMSAEILPLNATDPSVTWSVSTLVGGTATIVPETGVLTGTGVGTVIVKATANDGSNINGTKTVTVIAGVDVLGITVTGASTVVNGYTIAMSAEILPTNATNQNVTWSVSTLVGGTATIVPETGVLTGTGVGTVIVKATAKDGSLSTGTKTITVTAAVNVSSITVTGASTVVNGSTIAMSAEILPTNATNQSVTWSVATLVGGTASITSTGVLTGTKVGTVTVKATAKDGSLITGTKTVTVTAPVPVLGITVTGASTVVNGYTIAMSAEILPTNATNQNVTWSVSTLVGGTASITTTGVLTGTGVGTVIVKATAKDGSLSTGTKTITVTAAPVKVTDITVTGAEEASTVDLNKKLQMSVAVLPADATDNSVTWSVEPGTGTGTITSTGLLTGTGVGTVTVKATANDGTLITGTKIITVVAVPITGITLTGSASTVVKGSTIAMSAEILPLNATNQNITWSVATLVGGTASITSTGVLTGTGVGTVIVKATANDGSLIIGEKTITVTAAFVAVTSIAVSGSGGVTTVANSGDLQMTAVVKPTNATEKNVTWSVVAGTGTASINATGLLTGTGVGTVTVKATANDGSLITGTIEIKVVAVSVTSITVKGAGNAITVAKGDSTLQMSAIVLPETATEKNVTWSVAAGKGTASITPTGVLTGTGVGTVTVTATANDGSLIKGTKEITVTAAPIAVTSITVKGEGNASSVADSGTLQMSAAILPLTATNLNVKWSVTAGTGEAAIDEVTGLLTGKEVGTVTVTATSISTEAVSGSLLITVNVPFIITAPVLPASTTIGVPMPMTITTYGTGKGTFVWNWTGIMLQDTTTSTPITIPYTHASGTGDDMTITPTKMLDFGKTYTLTIPAGAVTDASSNPNLALIATISSAVPVGINAIDLKSDEEGVSANKVIKLTTNVSCTLDKTRFPITLVDASGNGRRLDFSVTGTEITVIPLDMLSGGSKYTLTVPAGALVYSTTALTNSSKLAGKISYALEASVDSTTALTNEESSITFKTAYNLNDLINNVYEDTLNSLMAEHSPRKLNVNVPKRYMTKFDIAYSTNSTNPLTNVDITAEDEVKQINVQFGTGGTITQAIKVGTVWNTGYEGSLTDLDDSNQAIGRDIIFEAFDAYGRSLEKKTYIKLLVKGSKLDLSGTKKLSVTKPFADLILSSGKLLTDILKQYSLDELTLTINTDY